MKTIRKFKPETVINCHVWDGEKFIAEPRQAMLFPQTDFPDHKFYITYSDTHDKGYRLTEYSTGMTFSGHYPDNTPNSAAKWYQKRLDQYKYSDILKLINVNIREHGQLN